MTCWANATAQVARQKQQLPPANPWSLLPELSRNAFASLALAIGFAGLARRGCSGLSLLAELQLGWQRLRYLKLSLRRNSGVKSSNREYWHQLGEGAEGEDDSRG